MSMIVRISLHRMIMKNTIDCLFAVTAGIAPSTLLASFHLIFTPILQVTSLVTSMKTEEQGGEVICPRSHS